MLFTSLSTVATALLFLTSSSTAHPTRQPEASDLTKLAAQFPKSNLPAPDGLVLKYVLLGIGTQNYTCTGNSTTATPGTTGAVAKLYDIGTTLKTDPWAPWKISTLSGLALSFRFYGQFLEQWLKMEGYSELLGNHFFTPVNATSFPTFSLDHVKATPFPRAMVAKKDEVDAPKTACQGNDGEGAVKWLRLVDDKRMSVGGVNTVYRVETAGGKSPTTCVGMKPAFEVAYAAQYWVFGPKA